jgi:membrane protein implicated in regulation of membrane protease activity
MVGTLRLFIDASYAIALMAFAGIVAGFATATITSDTQRSLQVAIGMFALTGALLTIRLWRLTRRTGLPPIDPVT